MLAQTLPADIPILMVLSDQIREVMRLLERRGVPVPAERLIHWEPDMVVYGARGTLQSAGGDAAVRNLCHPYGSVRPLTVVAADEIFVYGEWPYNSVSNPNSGGQNSFHPRDLLQAARRALVPPALFDRPCASILLIKRPGGGWGRSLGNHDELERALRALPAVANGRLALALFEGEGSVEGQSLEFAGACAVVGPHGAGFANLGSPPSRAVALRPCPAASLARFCTLNSRICQRLRVPLLSSHHLILCAPHPRPFSCSNPPPASLYSHRRLRRGDRVEGRWRRGSTPRRQAGHVAFQSVLLSLSGARGELCPACCCHGDGFHKRPPLTHAPGCSSAFVLYCLALLHTSSTIGWYFQRLAIKSHRSSPK